MPEPIETLHARALQLKHLTAAALEEPGAKLLPARARTLLKGMAELITDLAGDVQELREGRRHE